MAYDTVNYKAFCPQCGGFLGDWCSDSGTGLMLDTLEVWQVGDEN